MKRIGLLINVLISYIKYFFVGGSAFAKHIGVSVGKGCRIYTRNFGTEPFLVKIGNKCTVTKGVYFLTHDGSTWLFNDDKGRRYLYRPIEIGDNVFIGINAIILPGINVGSNVIIAAGSVVTKSIPSGKIVGGNPAKIIGDYGVYGKRVYENYVSDSDLDYNIPYKERILKVTEQIFKKDSE